MSQRNLEYGIAHRIESVTRFPASYQHRAFLPGHLCIFRAILTPIPGPVSSGLTPLKLGVIPGSETLVPNFRDDPLISFVNLDCKRVKRALHKIKAQRYDRKINWYESTQTNFTPIFTGHSDLRNRPGNRFSRNTIKGYFRTIKSRELNLQNLLGLEDLRIEHVLRAPLKTEKERQLDIMLRLDKLYEELKHPHLTNQLLWEEYKREYPGGYQYSQFCHYLQLYDRSQHATLIREHEPGDKIFIDFTGDKLHYVDCNGGEIIPCEAFVAALGYSNYTVVLATHSQKIEEAVAATDTALEYIGGSPRAIVPENLKSAVNQAHQYKPKINEVFLDMANHYWIAVLPTRARKPKTRSKWNMP